MRSLTVFLFILLLVAHTAVASSSAPPKMRPYTGIGILMLTVAGNGLNEPLPLYEEPGLSRLGSLNPGKIPRYDWIFGASPVAIPLIVTGRKGPWLRVAYDDAGREAGGIQAEDRHGVMRFFAFTSLSIGAVRVRRGQFRTAELVATAAAAAKHGAKQAAVGLFVRQGESMFAALDG